MTLDYHQCVFSMQTGELTDRYRVLSFWEKLLIAVAVVVVLIVLIIVGIFVGFFSLIYSLVVMAEKKRPR